MKTSDASMRRYLPLIFFGVMLLILAGILHYVHFLIFGDIHHILIYLMGDVAFLPLEVLFVVLVIERVMADREKHAMLQKLNMVIGAFYSEVGNFLLRHLFSHYREKEEMLRHFAVNHSWGHARFKDAMSAARSLKPTAELSPDDLLEIKEFLVGKRTFLLGLLENPNLLEHEKFTDLLWATFHLTEELEERTSFFLIPENDTAHILADIHRVYGYLIIEWLEYTEHLKENYPYLYSLIVRTHPFQMAPTAVIK